MVFERIVMFQDSRSVKLRHDPILERIKKALLEEGYQGAMLYVAQHTASMHRDELFRILTVCQINKVPSVFAADIIEKLHKI
jgi:hypothetical protein